MKILQICQRPQRRGAEVFAFHLADELRRRGHEVRTVYLYPYDGPGHLETGEHDHLLNGDDSNPLETLVGVGPALLGELRRVMRSFGPNVTQMNGARTVKYGVIARRLEGPGIGKVVYRNIGTIDDWVRGFRRKLFYRGILRGVDGVVAISRGALAALEASLPARTPRTVISNAVDPAGLVTTLPRADVRGSLDTPADVPVAAFVGSLAPEKRVDRILGAVRRVREGGVDLHAWIVGDGPLRRELEARASRAGLDAVVRFLGTREDIATVLGAADVFVLASDTEGVPGAVLEAGCVGLPVVATRVGGLEECVIQEETGILVTPGREEELVEALRRLAADPELRERMGRRGREHVLARHSIEGIADEYVRFYERIAHGDGSPGARGAVDPWGTEASPTNTDTRRTRRYGPEMRLLMLLARPELLPHTARAARELLPRIDWDRLVRLAGLHGLGPLVAGHLEGLGSEVPESVRAWSKSARRANASRTLASSAQLLEALAALEGRAVVAVPYKGPALSSQLYGSGALRRSVDLDILVRPRDVVESRRALASIGYRPRTPVREEVVRFMIHHRYHEELVRDDGGHVELHWAFTNRDFPFALDLDAAFGRLRSVPLAGRSVPAFHPEDLLLILCVHGAKHQWDRLEWLAGVAQLLRSAEGIDWEALLRRASSLGVRRTLFLGLRLASELFDAPLPVHVTARIRADRGAADLSERVTDILHGEPRGWDVHELVQRDRFRVRLRERWRDRIRFVWHRTTTPSDPEKWSVATLGPWHLPVHALRRPFHLVGRLAHVLRALLPSSA